MWKEISDYCSDNKNFIRADICFISLSATGLYKQKSTALLNPISAIFKTERIEVHNPDRPKYSELNFWINKALIKKGHSTKISRCNKAHFMFLLA